MFNQYVLNISQYVQIFVNIRYCVPLLSYWCLCPQYMCRVLCTQNLGFLHPMHLMRNENIKASFVSPNIRGLLSSGITIFVVIHDATCMLQVSGNRLLTQCTLVCEVSPLGNQRKIWGPSHRLRNIRFINVHTQLLCNLSPPA